MLRARRLVRTWQAHLRRARNRQAVACTISAPARLRACVPACRSRSATPQVLIEEADARARDVSTIMLDGAESAGTQHKREASQTLTTIRLRRSCKAARKEPSG